MSYEKPEIKKVEADVSVRNMADDKGECHGGHCASTLSVDAQYIAAASNS